MAALVRGTPLYEDQLIAWHNRRLWQLLIATALIVGVEACIIVTQYMRPGPPPYILTVDSHTGEPVGVIQPVLGTQTVPDPAVRWQLKQFLEYAFRVDKDHDEENDALRHAYWMTTGQAGSALTAWYKANDPHAAEAKGWQAVDVAGVVQVVGVPGTYESHFTTLWHPTIESGQTITNTYRATMRVVVGKPTTQNTLGLFISNLDVVKESN